MKSQLVAIVAAVLLVGCGAKTPDISIHDAAEEGNIEAVKQHLAAGTGVNAKDKKGRTPLHDAAFGGHKEIVELLVAKGADVNAEYTGGNVLDWAIVMNKDEIADLLRKHGGKTRKEGRDEIAELLRKHGTK